MQLVVGLTVSTSWLVGKSSLNVHGFSQFLLGMAITVVLSVATIAALLAQRTWRAKGVAMSIVGSLVLCIVGATAYGFWIIGW